MGIHNTGWLKITTHWLSLWHGREKCQLNLCLWMCTGMLMHTWVWLAMAAWGLVHPHICIIPVCFRLGQWVWIKLQRVCICSHADGDWILDSNCRTIRAWNAPYNPEHRWSWHFVMILLVPSPICTLSRQHWLAWKMPARPILALSLWENAVRKQCRKVVGRAILRTGWLWFSNSPLSGPHYTSAETDRTIDYPSLFQRTYNYRSL